MTPINNDFYSEYRAITSVSLLKEETGENHHIIPKSLGGSNDTNNIVRLSYKDHYRAHYLLTQFLEGEELEKMLYAWNRMNNTKKYPGIEILGEDIYESLREAHIKSLSENNPMHNPKHRQAIKDAWTPDKREARSKQYSGENNPMYGKNAFENKTDEEVKRLVQKRKETIANKTQEEIQQWNGKISASGKGKKHWTKQTSSEKDAWRQKISDTKSGVSNPSKKRKMCKHCGIEFNVHGLARHEKSCKAT